MKQDEERIEYFASSVDSSLLKIIVVAVVFHMLVVGACIAFNYVNLKPEPEMIPVFEMVKIPPTPQPPAPPNTQPPPPKLQPEPPPEEPVDDFPVDDMDLPVAMEAPSLDPVGSVDMDPLMQVYLEQLKKIIMGNFKPPKDLKVDRSAKTTVQFTVDRFGGITGILLKRSSGNKAWDHLSVRAIQISKVPELPPNYRAPSLVLNFNFTPN